MKKSTCEKFLGFKIDNRIGFDTHVKGLSKKGNNELSALARASISFEKRSFS